jgi:hypothetical protein
MAFRIQIRIFNNGSESVSGSLSILFIKNLIFFIIHIIRLLDISMTSAGSVINRPPGSVSYLGFVDPRIRIRGSGSVRNIYFNRNTTEVRVLHAGFAIVRIPTQFVLTPFLIGHDMSSKLVVTSFFSYLEHFVTSQTFRSVIVVEGSVVDAE